MEVTKSNFKDVLPVVGKAIEECTFCAIDTELTGLKTMNTEHAFDTMDERYMKLCEMSRNFLIIQFGLSCFKYHKDEKKYTHKDFNFYIFPRQHCNQAPDPIFMCQTSSLNYLVSHGFDFNKLLSEGISYLTPQQEQKLQQSLSAYHNEKITALTRQKENKKSQEPRSVPDDQREFIEDIHQQVEAFVSNHEKDTLNLPPCSAYRRKLIYEIVLPRHPSGISMSTTQNERRQSYIVVSKVTDEERLNKLQQKQTADMDDLDDAVGFRKVLEMISESRKLVVGHNMLLDLLHTINQFYYSLPPSLQEFKEMVKAIFPHLLDTKTLARSPSVRDFLPSTGLFNLWEDAQSKISPVPVVEPAENFQCYDADCDKRHEAGYDAYITGLCFAALSAKHARDHNLEYIGPESKFLSPYVNRPYIMRHFDVPSLNLGGPDPEPSRDHVFYVTFPREWKTVDLVELFLPFGEIYVNWLNDVSALVALKTPSQTANVRRTLLKQTGSVFKVCSYAEYREMQYEFKTPYSVDHRNRSPHIVDSELPYKRRRSSSGSTEGSVTNRSITPIPEEEEGDDATRNLSEKQDNCVTTSNQSLNASSKATDGSGFESPKPKKQKIEHDDSESSEVTSSGKLFEEPNDW